MMFDFLLLLATSCNVIADVLFFKKEKLKYRKCTHQRQANKQINSEIYKFCCVEVSLEDNGLTNTNTNKQKDPRKLCCMGTMCP